MALSLGLADTTRFSQGSLADSATLGFGAESLWDSSLEYPKGIEIFRTPERRVRARGLQPGCALVGRVPSRGAVLTFPSECELSGLKPFSTPVCVLRNSRVG